MCHSVPTVQIFQGSEMRVSGSKFRTGVHRAQYVLAGAMARYIAQCTWPAPYMMVLTGTYIALVNFFFAHLNSDTHVQTIENQHVQQFYLIRNFKFTTSLHSSALVGVL